MKKNIMMRAASGLAVATLLTTSLISGTFAKYTSSADGSDTARVAKWSFNVDNTNIAQDTTFTFDLFNTVKEADTTTAEAHIKNTDGTIIAPGTGGELSIELENTSEVTAKYAIKFNEENTKQIPIQYSIDGTTWKDDISDLNITGDSNELAYADGSKTITINWRWVYEGTTLGAHSDQTDQKDTALGKDGTAEVKVTAKVTATQVD